MYITLKSGHHKASVAIEKAIKSINSGVQLLNINSFNYTNPILEKIISKTYLGIIKTTPEVWEYLYDNPKVVKNTSRLRDLIHRYNSAKLNSLLDDFKPDVVVCTQAFPCGMVADFKRTHNLSTPLVGVLTDYLPHSYWIYDSVDRYVVQAEVARRRLIDSGVSPDKIETLGIPIGIEFRDRLDKGRIAERLGIDKSIPVVLIMGGGTGFGPIRRIVKVLDRVECQFQMVVIAGSNRRLLRWTEKRKSRSKKKLIPFGYVDNVHELMELANLVITKPGGLTTAEALAKGLPMIIVNPIPGQEANNSRLLLSEGIAVKGEDAEEVSILTERLLSNPVKLLQMREAAKRHARPSAALDITEMILRL